MAPASSRMLARMAAAVAVRGAWLRAQLVAALLLAVQHSLTRSSCSLRPLPRHPPGPAAPDLRRQAAGGRPHAGRLQHPEGVDAAPGAAPARRLLEALPASLCMLLALRWSC